MRGLIISAVLIGALVCAAVRNLKLIYYPMLFLWLSRVQRSANHHAQVTILFSASLFFLLSVAETALQSRRVVMESVSVLMTVLLVHSSYFLAVNAFMGSLDRITYSYQPSEVTNVL